jgi:pimeloyl-ACP methyl ester carboxylesterase
MGGEPLGAADEDIFRYPGVRPPARTFPIDAGGVQLQGYEWGDPGAPPLLMAHGGFDFARTLDVFAPIIADAGWRVVSWDHRGHGDSQHTALYSFDADERDLLAVADACIPEPCPVVGHSKGGALFTHVILAMPHRFTRFVAIDGLPWHRSVPDVADRLRTTMISEEISGWLDHRRRAATLARKPGTAQDLAQRRGRMNPRLSREWLQYLVGVGARRDPDGWRWKIDPALRMGGFGPWRWQWMVDRMPGFPIPLLGLLGTEFEEMGWGVDPDDLRRCLPRQARLEVLKGVGHFIHIERPRETAQLVLDFLREDAP